MIPDCNATESLDTKLALVRSQEKGATGAVGRAQDGVEPIGLVLVGRRAGEDFSAREVGHLGLAHSPQSREDLVLRLPVGDPRPYDVLELVDVDFDSRGVKHPLSHCRLRPLVERGDGEPGYVAVGVPWALVPVGNDDTPLCIDPIPIVRTSWLCSTPSA